MISKYSKKLFLLNLNKKKLFFGAVGILILGILFINLSLLRGDKHTNTKDNSSNIYDASPLIISDKYQFINSKLPAPSNWASNRFDDSNWRTETLGKNELKTLTGFKNINGVILHRIRLQIPKPLYELNQPIAFYIPGVLYSRYQIFIAGRQISDDIGLTDPFDMALVSIAKSDIDRNLEVVISIRGEYKAEDLGLAFYSVPQLGLKNEFGYLYVNNERVNNSYYNVIMAIKAGFLLFFIILFLMTKPQRFMAFFLVFAICNTLGTIFIIERFGEFLPLNLRALFMFNIQLIGYGFLWLFVESLFETKIKLQRWIIITQLVGLNCLLLCFLFGKYNIDLRIIFKFYHLCISENLFAMMILALVEYRTKSHQVIANLSIKIYLFVFTTYFTMNTGLHYFASKFNNNSHQPLDALFFIFVGFVAASEFLRNQVRVAELSRTLEKQAPEVELGQSAARIAHDIRKPFSNLKIALETIKLSNFDPKIITSVFTEVSNTIAYGEELAQQILLSKTTDITQMKPCSPNQILERFLDLEGPNLQKHNIVCQSQILSTRQFLGNETMVISIIQNIVNNSIEAFGQQEQKHLTICFEDYRNSIGTWLCRLIIKNNGPAIPKQVLNLLFKQSVTYGKANGTGLGLTGVKSLADRMNAEISVYNIANHKGVACEINFLTSTENLHDPTMSPKTNVLEIDRPIANQPTPPKVIERIIVVDDDELIRMAWKLVWPTSGLELFETPEQVLMKADADPNFLFNADLIITDQYFGSKSATTGIEFCRQLNSFDYDRVILCSGSDSKNLNINCNFLKIIEKQILNKDQLTELFLIKNLNV